MHRTRRRFVPMLLLVGLVAPAAWALAGQEQIVRPTRTEPVAEPSIFASQPIDADQSRLVSMLEGSWRTVEPVGQGDGAARVWMHVLPFESESMGRAMYVEVARDGAAWNPVRQSIFRVYRYGDRLRLRVYEFRDPNRPRVLTNLWLAPDAIPLHTVRPFDLAPTMDIEMGRVENGYAGQTPNPYPTRDTASVEMTTRLGVRPDRLVTHDTFYGMDGQAMMEGATGEIAWERATLDADIQRDDDGLIILTLDRGDRSDLPADDGDVVFLNYEGYLANGTQVESTWQRGLALRYVHPGRSIAGFQRAAVPTFEGVRRRVVIPPMLGYGEQAVGPIPGGSTLYYHLHVPKIDRVGDPPSPDEGPRRP